MKEITEELTSDETVSGYIIKLTESLFPQGSSFFKKMGCGLEINSRKGYPALPKEKRSENEVILTGLFCRAKLMTAIPENLRHMLG